MREGKGHHASKERGGKKHKKERKSRFNRPLQKKGKNSLSKAQGSLWMNSRRTGRALRKKKDFRVDQGEENPRKKRGAYLMYTEKQDSPEKKKGVGKGNLSPKKELIRRKN